MLCGGFLSILFTNPRDPAGVHDRLSSFRHHLHASTVFSARLEPSPLLDPARNYPDCFALGNSKPRYRSLLHPPRRHRPRVSHSTEEPN